LAEPITVDTGAAPSFEGWTCPLPLRDSPTIVMGHGGGGAMSAELVEHVFLPSFRDEALARLADSAVLDLPGLDLGGSRLAFSTDSFVVRPLFFPGGSIGDLAVNGTVNDLAMSGAQPLFLSIAFILEEGTDLTRVGAVAQRIGAAADRAGVRVVTGDTKVVESGHGDGIYLNTTGIGLVSDGVDIRPDRAEPGDVVIVSGAIGVHGIAIMSVREGLQFGADVESDCQPLHGLVEALLGAAADVHVLRDPTRGGVATSLNEIAGASRVGIELEERSLPIPEVVANACAFLGLDPLQVANEGKLLAFVPPGEVDAVLAAMRAHPAGADAAVIGRCVAEHPGMVAATTGFGASRVVDLPLGEQLPRIC
jgi:hydrogenase expression/formation protein HypE